MRLFTCHNSHLTCYQFKKTTNDLEFLAMISSNDIWFHDTMWGRLFAKDGICLFIAFNHKLLIKL